MKEGSQGVPEQRPMVHTPTAPSHVSASWATLGLCSGTLSLLLLLVCFANNLGTSICRR